jgi:hypothetical protein
MSARKIQVAGDLCIDVIGVPQPRPSIDADSSLKNWQLTGEIRTQFLRGGALLLADMVSAAVGDANVYGPVPQVPPALRRNGKGGPLDESLFVRLTKDEIVHSVLRVDECKAAKKSEKDSKEKTLRVVQSEGFAGPTNADPSIAVTLEEPGEVDIVVLDDTGNSFRRMKSQWPEAIKNPNTSESPLIVYKLHRPVPTPDAESKASAGLNTAKPAISSPLWKKVVQHYAERRIVVISVDDLRDHEVQISRGLSWERTALDVVWHLMNEPRWLELKRTPHLIVRLGLDGAIYWRGNSTGDDSTYKAWLVYVPKAIEGDWEDSFEKHMVAYGTAFTAGLVKVISQRRGLIHLDGEKKNRKEQLPLDLLIRGIRAGMKASRRLLFLGFQRNGEGFAYPGKPLFEERIDGLKEDILACQPIPIIPGATVPDRGYWRLIDSIFSGGTQYRDRAVALTAIGAAGTKSPDNDDKKAQELLDQVPLAVFAVDLCAFDRREIESYRALYSLMYDYVRQPAATRPLSVAVFGPPGAGKSFGVKKVAKALEGSGFRPIETLTFNLSQYRDPEELASAFHLVRDKVLSGKIPLVFFDEFDTALADNPLGWLRYFLSPMQDAEFVDRGTPHPIGQSIFIFAGGTCKSFAEFAKPFDAPQTPKDHKDFKDFKDAKGPDFISRLRGTLDIPGLDLDLNFDAYGPTDAFPCESAILFRRASILNHQLGEKASGLIGADKVCRVSPPVLRALLYLPRFDHGNRSFEALLDMSHLVDAKKFTPSMLPASNHASLHANAGQLTQLLARDYPFPPKERELIAKKVHSAYLEVRRKEGLLDRKDRSLRPWDKLDEDLKESNRQQADHIAVKLRKVGLWFRKKRSGLPTYSDVNFYFASQEEKLAQMEHDRWVAEKRQAGWIPAPDMNRDSLDKDFKKRLRLHNSIFPWNELTDEMKDLDRSAVRRIPEFLEAGEYEIYAPLDNNIPLPQLGIASTPESKEVEG